MITFHIIGMNQHNILGLNYLFEYRKWYCNNYG